KTAARSNTSYEFVDSRGRAGFRPGVPKARTMAFSLRLLRNPFARVGLLIAVGIGMIVSAFTSFSSPQRHVDDLNWLAGEHSTAGGLPYFDAARNLNLGSTPQAPCGPGSRPETSW